MSDTRPMWSFAHQQSADSAPYYTSNPYKPRQNPRRHFHPAGTLPTVAEIADPRAPHRHVLRDQVAGRLGGRAGRHQLSGSRRV